VCFNKGTNESDITVSDCSAPDNKRCFHGPLYSILFYGTPAKNTLSLKKFLLSSF
jgi:hypothetical protein